MLKSKYYKGKVRVKSNMRERKKREGSRLFAERQQKRTKCSDMQLPHRSLGSDWFMSIESTQNGGVHHNSYFYLYNELAILQPAASNVINHTLIPRKWRKGHACSMHTPSKY